jgi:predicted RNA-binding Zn-ribbon protein involved in translation (DUF1610 family)
MLKKISDLPAMVVCRSTEHNPPSMIVLSPGVYEHTCPNCGHITRFTVGGAVCQQTTMGQLGVGDLVC